MTPRQTAGRWAAWTCLAALSAGLGTALSAGWAGDQPPKPDKDKANVTVPGRVDPNAPVGIPNAPDVPNRNVPAPPGLDTGGTGAPSILDQPGGFGVTDKTPGGFGGRTGATRKKLLEDGGGNAASETAVARGLQFLARHQAADGHWSLNHFEKDAHDDQGKPTPLHPRRQDQPRGRHCRDRLRALALPRRRPDAEARQGQLE